MNTHCQTADLKERLTAPPTRPHPLEMTLWAVGKYDVGLLKDDQPPVITDWRPYKAQYPLKQETTDGITADYQPVKAAGVIIPADDPPVHTSLEQRTTNRTAFTEDLQAVNGTVQPKAPKVPNASTIWSQLPTNAQFFSVVDLSNAFFTVLGHPDSQFWLFLSLQWTKLHMNPSMPRIL